MKRHNSVYRAWFAAGGMALLILDSKSALSGAVDGLELCFRTAIPSLFPFFVFSILLTGALSGRSVRLLKPISRLCGIPEGGEALLAIGLLGGYPVGAQCIYKTYCAGQLSKQEAGRLMGFCSNAGPSFIFGIAASLFTSTKHTWVLWMIHVFSALIVGFVLPGKSTRRLTVKASESATLQQVLQQSLIAMGCVCGWIILFRIAVAVFNRWFLWLFPKIIQCVVIGLLELTNGCLALGNIESECIRFIFCAALLGFGGVCVGMQTVSVTAKLGTGLYFPGKVMQGVFSVVLAFAVSPFLFPAEEIPVPPEAVLPTMLILAVVAATILIFSKKTVAFLHPVMYNEKKEI